MILLTPRTVPSDIRFRLDMNKGCYVLQRSTLYLFNARRKPLLMQATVFA
jgi:hypothetical protein